MGGSGGDYHLNSFCHFSEMDFMDSKIPARIIFGITELEESDVEKDIIDASRQGYELKDMVSFLKAKYAGNDNKLVALVAKIALPLGYREGVEHAEREKGNNTDESDNKIKAKPI